MHPVLLKTPYFTIYTYGVCVALAALLAWGLALAFARKTGHSAPRAVDFLFVLFLAGVAGSRLFYALQHPDEYAGRWHAVFFLQEGGLVWYGGFLAAAAAGIAYARAAKLGILAWADFFSPIAAAAHAAGRVGCFLNGCCFGRNGHPVQLYESALLAALAVALSRRLFHKKREGEVFAFYLAGYGLMRFLLEFLRGDQQPLFGLTIPQWISLALAAAGAALYARLKKS